MPGEKQMRVRVEFKLSHKGENYYVVEMRDDGLLEAVVFVTPKDKDGNVNAQVALMPNGNLFGNAHELMLATITAEALRIVAGAVL